MRKVVFQSASRLVRGCWTGAFRHVIEEPMCHAIGCPFGAQARPALNPPQSTQEVTIEFTRIGSFEPAVYVEPVRRFAYGAVNKLPEQRFDCGRGIRTQVAD